MEWSKKFFRRLRSLLLPALGALMGKTASCGGFWQIDFTYFVLLKAGKFAGAGLCHQKSGGWMGCQTACRLSGDLGIRPIKFHLASYLMPGKGQGGYQGTFFRFHIQYAIHGYWKDLLIQLIPLA